MKEMLLWPQRVHVRNDGRSQWYGEKAAINIVSDGQFNLKKLYVAVDFSTELSQIEFENAKQSMSELISNLRSRILLRQNLDVYFFFMGSSQDFVGDIFHFQQLNENHLIVAENYINAAQQHTGFSEGTTTYYKNFFNGEWDEGIFIIVAKNFYKDDPIAAQEFKQGNSDLFSRVKCKTVQIGVVVDNNLEVVDSYGPSFAISSNIVVKAAALELTDKAPYYFDYADLNPVHKIREILTDDTAMNKPESEVNDTNFRKAADLIYTENLGISWSVTEKSCLEAINELCGHIEAGLRMNRQTGLYEMVLFRDDWFNEDEIHTLPVNKIKSMQLDGAVSADELVNKLNVSYYNREAIKNSSFSVAENAAIRNLNGHENSEEVKFPYFMNQRNSAVVAQWKLKQMSTPVWQGTLTTGFYEARKWNRYDLLKLAWPKKWNGTILVRILKINLGTATEVSIDFVEVVPYSSNLTSSIVIDTPVDVTPKPPQPALFKAFELSYFEAVQLNGQKAVDDALAYNPDAGYAAVIAKRPQTNSLNALMYTDIGNDYERTGTIQYCETAALDQNISQLETSFIVKNAGAINMVNLDTQITVNNELMIFKSYDDDTGLLTVKRGALDTIPQRHMANSILYFADDFITVDPTEYVKGEVVDVKALTTTPSGILSLDVVPPQHVEMHARAICPYPPANVKINGLYWPESLIVTTALTIDWVDRNRLQQTGGEILGFYDAGVSAESGVTYSFELSTAQDGVILSASEITGNSFIVPATTLIPNKAHKLKMWAVRGGYNSTIFEHSFFAEAASLLLTASVTRSNIVGNTVPTASISVNVDESLIANMKFDGTSISGKAPAGSTITIEIEE
ncbi:hypothetical protein D3C78_672590 [compost metagenome]